MAQVLPADLDARLARGLAACYTLVGVEPLQQFESAAAVRAAARAAGYAGRSVFTVAGVHFDWSAVAAAVGARSLFAERNIVELRIPSGKPGRDGSAALQQLAPGPGPAPDTLLLVSLGARLDRAARHSAWFGALDRAGVVVACDPVERRLLPQWIARRLARHGLRVPAGDAGRRALAFFADRVEGNLLAAHQEIEKLALLHPVAPGQTLELSLDAVAAAVLDVARYDVFQLVEAVLAGHLARAERMLAGLAGEGQAAVLVHWALAEEIRTIARVRAALDAGRPLPLALGENRVWGARERAYAGFVGSLPSATAERLLRMARACDGIVKGLTLPGWPAQPWDALRRLMLALLAAVAPSERSAHLALTA